MAPPCFRPASGEPVQAARRFLGNIRRSPQRRQTSASTVTGARWGRRAVIPLLPFVQFCRRITGIGKRASLRPPCAPIKPLFRVRTIYCNENSPTEISIIGPNAMYQVVLIMGWNSPRQPMREAQSALWVLGPSVTYGYGDPNPLGPRTPYGRKSRR